MRECQPTSRRDKLAATTSSALRHTGRCDSDHILRFIWVSSISQPRSCCSTRSSAARRLDLVDIVNVRRPPQPRCRSFLEASRWVRACSIQMPSASRLQCRRMQRRRCSAGAPSSLQRFREEHGFSPLVPPCLHVTDIRGMTRRLRHRACCQWSEATTAFLLRPPCHLALLRSARP